jgi:quinol monooxygenase YgiN
MNDMGDPKTRLVVTSKLRLKTDIETFSAVARRAVEASSAEPGVVSYCYYYNPETKECDTIVIFRDSEALVTHVQGDFGKKILPELLSVAERVRSDLYGNPSEEVLRELSPRPRSFHPGPTFGVR